MTKHERDQIERLERTGVMEQRRRVVRGWFEAHPNGTAAQAVRELGFSHADEMYVIADSIRMDLLRQARAEAR